MYYNKYHNQINDGKEAEKLARKILRYNDFKVYNSTKEQNKLLHIDLICLHIPSDTSCTIDVKNVGKYGYTCELSNNLGYSGSLYGNADYIGYVNLTEQTLELVNRKQLIELVDSKIPDKTNSLDSSFAQSIPGPYIIYDRKRYGWNDKWVILDHKDLLPITRVTLTLKDKYGL